MNYFDEQVGQFMDEAMSAPFDLVLGRKTYDIFAAGADLRYLLKGAAHGAPGAYGEPAQVGEDGVLLPDENLVLRRSPEHRQRARHGIRHGLRSRPKSEGPFVWEALGVRSSCAHASAPLGTPPGLPPGLAP